MPLVVGPDIARVGPSVGAVKTSPAFDAPAGSLDLVTAVVDTAGVQSASMAYSNNGDPLTWIPIGQRGGDESGGRPGTVYAAYAVVPTARSGLTNTTTTSTSVRNNAMKPYLLAGAAASPIGAVLEGSAPAGTNVLTTPPLITTAPDSLVFILANESEMGPGLPTSPDTMIDPYVSSGNHSGVTGHQPGGPAGSSITFTIDAAGTSTAISWNWLAFEVLAAPARAPLPPTRQRRNRPLLLR